MPFHDSFGRRDAVDKTTDVLFHRALWENDHVVRYHNLQFIISYKVMTIRENGEILQVNFISLPICFFFLLYYKYYVLKYKI